MELPATPQDTRIQTREIHAKLDFLDLHKREPTITKSITFEELIPLATQLTEIVALQQAEIASLREGLLQLKEAQYAVFGKN